jgi:hypothetical protein
MNFDNIEKRIIEITNKFPDTLDIKNIEVSKDYNFDKKLDKVIENLKNIIYLLDGFSSNGYSKKELNELFENNEIIRLYTLLQKLNNLFNK